MVNPIVLNGFEQFGRKLNTLSKEVLEEIDEECRDAGRYWEQLAKNSVSANQITDKGRLVQNITTKPVAKLNYEVTAGVLYAPYQEWGTITRVSVPAELTQYAIQFKGEGKRKTGGVKPHPFFFIHKHSIEDFLVKNIKVILEKSR